MRSTVLYIPFFILAASCAGEPTKTDDAYYVKIEHEREEKRDYLENNPNSPLHKAKPFEPPQFFPINEEYLVEASVSLTHSDSVYFMPTTDGRRRGYTKYAKVRFLLEDKQHELTLLNTNPLKDDPSLLFLPFRDLTTGKSTYGGGRFLDVRLEDTTKLWLDFNQAYNPYCAYNGSYSCPVPPPYNFLRAMVEAGEKDYTGPYVGTKEEH